MTYYTDRNIRTACNPSVRYEECSNCNQRTANKVCTRAGCVNPIDPNKHYLLQKYNVVAGELEGDTGKYCSGDCADIAYSNKYPGEKEWAVVTKVPAGHVANQRTAGIAE